MKPRKNKKNSRAPLLTLVIVLLIAGTAAILTPLLIVERELYLDSEAYEQLKEQSRKAANAPDPPRMPELGFLGSIPLKVGKTGVDLAACKAENGDFIAWIQIPGTTVDYPVVLTDDTDYYLNHTFAGKKSYLGTLFSLGKTDYRTPGKNLAVYGHHIRSNSETMFSPLLSYKQESFYAGHKTIYLDTLYHSGVYTVFAVINMRDGDWDPSAASFASDQDFLDYVHRAKSQSLYDTRVDVSAKDQILTLITCDRSYIPTYGRLVVMAVKQEPSGHPYQFTKEQGDNNLCNE